MRRALLWAAVWAALSQALLPPPAAPASRSACLAANFRPIELKTTPSSLPLSNAPTDPFPYAFDEPTSPPPASSLEHIQALLSNSQSLTFYKSFGTWNNEYISHKVSMALNLEIAALSSLLTANPNHNPAQATTARQRSGKAKKDSSSKGTKATRRLKPRHHHSNSDINSNLTAAADRSALKTAFHPHTNLNPNTNPNRNPSCGGDTKAYAPPPQISEEEVKSGLIALLTLYDLAHNPNPISDLNPNPIPNPDPGTKSMWNNPEGPEQLARFAREVEALGGSSSSGGGGVGGSGGNRGVCGSGGGWGGGRAARGGLRVAGAKVSWKYDLRRESGTPNPDLNPFPDPNPMPNPNPNPPTTPALDIDRLVINDLALNLLEVAREDLMWRLGRGAGEGLGVVAYATGTTGGSAFPDPNPNPNPNPSEADSGKHTRIRGRERARRKNNSNPNPSSDDDYTNLVIGIAGLGVVDRSGLDLGLGLGSGRPFLTAAKRHTEIVKVTCELFGRRGGQLFAMQVGDGGADLCVDKGANMSLSIGDSMGANMGNSLGVSTGASTGATYCACAKELAVVLLLWAHKVPPIIIYIIYICIYMYILYIYVYIYVICIYMYI